MKIGVPYTDSPQSDVPCTREDEAIAFAAGVILAGGEAEVFMQDSGLGNSVNVITSLLKPYKIKMNIFVRLKKN